MTQKELGVKIQRLEDYRDICNLQGRYNHYMLSNRHDKILDLFSKKDPGVKIEIDASGEYRGLEGVMKVFKIIGEKYKFAGGLPLHMILTPVIEVAKDGKTAKGMWHSFGCNTIQTEDGLKAMWQAGKYDIEFVKEDGEWKYRVFKWYVIFRTPFDEGWVKMPIIGSLQHESQPPISPLYAPYDPTKDAEFLPLPPEPEE
jgi:hypothetical protein